MVDITHEVPTSDELVELYGSVAWSAYADKPDVLHRAVTDSPFVAAARIDAQLVGLLRAVSDDATIAYLQDVLVHPDHQRSGVGRRLVEAFLARYAHVRQRVLLTDDDPAQRAFYEALGFTRSDEVDGGPLHAFVDLGARGVDPVPAATAREGHIAHLRTRVGTALLLVPSVSVCLRDDEGRILLGHHRRSGVWSTPGGAVEPGESVADACVREAREELGIDVTPAAIMGVFGPDEIVYPNGDRTSYVTTAFACTTSQQLSPDGDELDELRWFDQHTAGQLNVATWLQPRLADLLSWTPTSPALFDPPGRPLGPQPDV